MASKSSSKKTVQARTGLKKSAPSSNSGKKFGYVLLALLGVVFFYHTGSFDFIQDDSFITYRYVKHFAEGNGLVFNIGEKVEGYTCFLWVILLAFVKILGINFVSASQTLGVLFSLLTLLFTFLISADIFRKEPAKSLKPGRENTYYYFTFSLIAVLLVVSNGAFAYWAASGMETALFGFLITLGIYLYLKESTAKQNAFPYSSLIFLLASLTRPEGNIIFAVTVIHKVITVMKSPGENRTRALISKNNLTWLLVYIVPAVIYMIWRFSYYGYLLPNTYYAKTGSSLEYFKTGLEYFWDFAVTYGLYGFLVVLTLINLKSKDKFYEYLYLILIFFIFSIYVILIGGDVLRPARFFVPLIPVFYILVQEALHRLAVMYEKKISASYAAALVIIAVLVFGYFTYNSGHEQIKRYSELENGLVEKMKITGGWLKKKSAGSGPNLTVAATTIGAISYYSDVNLIDMLGLTDKVIAHDPQPIAEISEKSDIGWKERNYNVRYILSRKPDYIYFSTGIKPSAYAERGLFTSPEFLKYYYPYYFTVGGFTDCIYKRKSDEEVKQDSVSAQHNPNYKKTFVNLYNQAINTSRDKSKLKEAVDLFNRTLEIAPSDFAEPYQMIGDIYLQAKDKDRAIEYYKKAVERNDYSIMSHYYLYYIYLEKNDTLKAIEHLNKVRKYSPDMLK
jgi:tetratricopeptide (TPR) repeat protein